MTHAAQALGIAKKVDVIATDIVTDMSTAIRIRCDDRPEFMAIMLSAVHHKLSKLLAETEQKARAHE